MLAQAAIVLSALAAPIKPPAQACAQPQYTRWTWSPGEIVIGSVFTTALWIDRKQTLALRTAGYRETNWFTGPRPSAGRVNMYTISFTIVGLGTLDWPTPAAPPALPVQRQVPGLMPGHVLCCNQTNHERPVASAPHRRRTDVG